MPHHDTTLLLPVGPDLPPPADPAVSYFRQWLAPPTVIAMAVALASVFVMYYRVEQSERQIQRLERMIVDEHNAAVVIYQRRDVLVEQLRLVEMRLSNIELALGVRRSQP